MIRDATTTDAAAICEIYNYYVECTIITFEEVPISVEDMATRIEQITRRLPWIVHEEEGQLLGYAYAGDWKARSAYRYAAESTIYLAQDAIGRGIGKRLYGELIDRLRRLDIRTVIAGIALPNPASVALQEKLGFKKVGHFKQIGRKLDRWIDVGYWQLDLLTSGNAPE